MACKPREETTAAGTFLRRLIHLAHGAGGEAPLPERPATGHLQDLQSLSGNEQLLGILDRDDELLQNIEDWTRAGALAEKRLPAHRRLRSLAHHAQGLDTAREVQPQIEAITANRSLLDLTDPVPGLIKTLTDALRAALVEAERHYREVFDQESARLDAAESWQKIQEPERGRILKELGITRASKGATGTDQEVLESLERLSLEAWRTRRAALPQRFVQARIQADRLVEPTTHHVKLDTTTLRTPEEVRAWVTKTEHELLEQIRKGPIVVS